MSYRNYRTRNTYKFSTRNTVQIIININKDIPLRLLEENLINVLSQWGNYCGGDSGGGGRPIPLKIPLGIDSKYFYNFTLFCWQWSRSMFRTLINAT